MGELSVTDVGYLERFSHHSMGVGGEAVAPDGGIFRFFKIKFENSDIVEQTVPVFTSGKGRYENFGENVEYLIGGFSTEIAVRDNAEVALIPDDYPSRLSYSGLKYFFGNPTINGYPDNWNRRPRVKPNSRLEGWVWGMTRDSGSVDCRISYRNNVYKWKPTEEGLDTAPSNEAEITI
jgi:hypothetical protein